MQHNVAPNGIYCLFETFGGWCGMLAVENPNRTPPRGFRYIQPETGQPFSSIDMTAMLGHIQQHRLHRSLDLSPGWQKRVEDEMCRQNGWAGTVCQDAEAIDRAITTGDVKNFISVLWSLIEKRGSAGAFVDASEAERRATICAACPMNKEVPGCYGMCPGGMAKMILKFTTFFRGQKVNLTTSRDEELKSCAVCGCANSSQVHVGLDILREVKGEFDYPEPCWKR